MRDLDDVTVGSPRAGPLGTGPCARRPLNTRSMHSGSPPFFAELVPAVAPASVIQWRPWNFERPNVREDLRPRRTSQRQVVTSNVSVGVPVARSTSLDTDAHAPHLSRVRVAGGRVGDDLVDHIGASHLVQCLDVLDDSDLMRDPGILVGVNSQYFGPRHVIFSFCSIPLKICG